METTFNFTTLILILLATVFFLFFLISLWAKEPGADLKTNVFHSPGEFMIDEMDALGMSQEEFGEKMNLTEADTEALLKGELPVTKEIAKRLSEVLTGNETFWLTLQTNYDYWKESQKETTAENETAPALA
jgi:addiction module HigA family antidote